MSAPRPDVPPLTPPLGLCLGGMDPSAGAGLLRDVQALAELGCQPMAVSLAETLQNGLGCTRIDPPAMDPITRVETLAPHLVGRWGLKLSLCAMEAAAFRRLCATLRHLAPPRCIWDPILAPSAGVGLHDGSDLRRMAADLLPTGRWVVSPNRGEAAAFAGLPPEAIRHASVEALTNPWLEVGAEAVWLKGGHASGDQVQDVWVTQQGVTLLPPSPRLSGERRGTGCLLSATWLGLRLLGRDDLQAAAESAHRLRERWDRAFSPGGIGRPMFSPAPVLVEPS
ncbi:bifunctional hydroxymethylpyrimidine kinase/phosphomethylpyrimidine kinase [Geothrix sp. PMB-07]|uniref:bifunctional hydroxymethylpyrimidine kinase/phosphomethylpyrimidine kinase n=1 Tax=Geothrix sp. PMB-07 TaxID=3068640 RepID=UPI002741ED17|nr:bifunctional hydroxymethylpyrimidine kinase/phosphomethylpyrimidine kinase [Geothrix sp. PMB-07]WLT30238.1 bifunctional hydroxymethylpyrimidine kinase/phosphomethylpyrimidine kinase [Geothrix sp. PMB-07]